MSLENAAIRPHESEESKIPAEQEENGPESHDRVKEAGREWMSFSDVLSKSGEAMTAVTAALDRERNIAAEVRRMGGRVTMETAKKIQGLEHQRNRLEQVIDKTAGFMSDTGAEEGVTLTPEDFNEITKDPDAFEITDDMIVEMQPEMELKVLEAQLVDETERAQDQIIKVATQINGLRKPPERKMPGNLASDEEGDFLNTTRRLSIGILEQRLGELEGILKDKPVEVAADAHPYDVNVYRMQKELYDKHSQEFTKLSEQHDQLKLEQEIQDIADQQIGEQMAEKATLDAETAAAEAAYKDKLAKDPRALNGLPESANFTKWTEEANNELLIGVLESQIGDLQNYVRVMGEKLKGVREDLGLQRGPKKTSSGEAPEARKAA